ncbi:sensory box histidine kinase/response regulator [alpha proteobacterium U9-1i]|nr:sensory box histidine kinase/response regulator [alpha proteobacterium U9-1i]
MLGTFWIRIDRFAGRHRVWLSTLWISAAITCIALLADYLVNVVLMPGVTPYTPIGTLVIVLLIAPPFVFTLLRQTEKVREAQARLAAEQASRAALEAAHAARNTFLANTSHELRTPLNGIIGYTELMQETAQEEGRAKDAADHQRVISLAQRLLHLMNDLLDLAKVEANQILMSPASYDVRKLIEDAIDGVRPEIERNRNRVSLHIDAELVAGRADPFRLGQCVLNLVSNAAKFTSDGEIAVRATRAAIEGVDWLSIEVADTGIGIAQERQVVLFEPFMQADASSSAQGTGLGLAITRQLARLMGGDVSVRSTPSKGSCFTLRLPLVAVEAAQVGGRIAA